MKRYLSVLLSLILAACATTATDVSFRRQFDYFYPDDPRYVTKMYRDAYRKLMADPVRHGDLGHASIGDRQALHRFLLRASTEPEKLDGEYGETYAYDLRFLLIRVGDLRFAEALRALTYKQRERVVPMLDCLIHTERDWYPQTTATYVYRYQRSA